MKFWIIVVIIISESGVEAEDVHGLFAANHGFSLPLLIIGDEANDAL